MSAPILWIVFPLLVAILLWVVRQRRRLVATISVVLCLSLALAAAIVPIGGTWRLGNIVVQIQPALGILGRQLQLTAADRPLLILFFVMGSLWFWGAYKLKSHPFFIPHGLALLSLLVAAIAVEPFLYVAPMIVMAILMSLPLLIPPGNPTTPAALRFLALQILALPPVLLGAWILGQFEGVQQPEQVYFAALCVALGFALWMGIFPFHTWATMLPEKHNPYVAGFLLSFVPTTVLIASAKFLNEFFWLRTLPTFSSALQLVGWLMVLASGIWFISTRNLRRALGFALMLDSGYGLIALSIPSQSGILLLLESLPSRFLALYLLAFSLNLLTNFDEQANLAMPLPALPSASGSIPVIFLIACLSIGGLPLLASYPVRQATLLEVAGQSHLSLAGLLIGNSLFLIKGIVLLGEWLATLEGHPPQNRSIPITTSAILFGCTLGLLLLGTFPMGFLSPAIALAQAFPNLLR